MTREEKVLSGAETNAVAGGAQDAPAAPKHDGDLCHECKMCHVRFVRFQYYQNRWEEVCECPYCGPVVFRH